MRRMLGRNVAIGFLVLVISGCAGLGNSAKTASSESASKDNQDEVSKLAISRWAELIKGDLDNAYQYISPGTRKIMSLELYKAKIRPGSWKKATVNSISCGQDKCKVAMAVVFANRKIGTVETIVEETWLLENGKWWYIPSN